MTTHWSEHKVKESNIDEVVASTKSTALKMACEAAKNIHPNWFNSEVFLTTSVVVDGNWYDGDEGTARLTDNDGLAAIQTVSLREHHVSDCIPDSHKIVGTSQIPKQNS